MSHKNLRHVPLALAAMAACLSAHAEYTFADGKLRLSGFGTVGVARTNTGEALFNVPGQADGADKSASFNPDTKLGLQGTYKFIDSLSVTTQLMTKYRATGQYTPEFEWAFAKWQALPALTVRVGRIGAPYFMVSDFRDVGYANTTLRPAPDVYGQVPVSSLDGGDISYQANVGSATLTTTVWGGQTKVKYVSGQRSQGADVPPVEIKLRQQLGLNLQAEFDGGFTLRAGHADGKMTVNSASVNTLVNSLNPVLLGLAGAGPKLLAQGAVDALTAQSTDVSFSGVGFSMDRDNIVMASEYTWRKAKSGTVSDTSGWYVMGGYRIGTWLPYAVVSRLKTDDLNGTINPALAKVSAKAYAGAVTLQNVGLVTQNTLSVGTRWDLHSGMALKAQLDRVSKPSKSNGLFLIPDVSTASGQDFFNNKKKVNVLSVALDFVF